MTRTTIVIPCYNEAERLDVDRFVEYALREQSHRLLLVNDGSSDATHFVLEDLLAAVPDQLDVCHLPHNVGKAEAVRHGVLQALDSQPDYIGYWDADLATPLEAIDDFVSQLQQQPQVQLVMGARVRLLGRSIDRRPARHYLGRIFAAAASSLLRLPVYDTQCGAKLFRVTDQTRGLFAKPFLSNWIFDVEILARMINQPEARCGLPIEQVIYELPLHQWHDVAGSKVRGRDFFKAVIELARIYRKYLCHRPHHDERERFEREDLPADMREILAKHESGQQVEAREPAHAGESA